MSLLLSIGLAVGASPFMSTGAQCFAIRRPRYGATTDGDKALPQRDERKRVEMRFAHLKTHHGFDREEKILTKSMPPNRPRGTQNALNSAIAENHGLERKMATWRATSVQNWARQN